MDASSERGLLLKHTTDYLELRDSSRGKKEQQQNLGISIHNGLKGVKLVFPNIPEFKF